jgi:hypothetical protein
MPIIKRSLESHQLCMMSMSVESLLFFMMTIVNVDMSSNQDI